MSLMNEVFTSSSQGSQEMAHNTDDLCERHRLRNEAVLLADQDYESLNNFEKQVRDGNIDTHQLPLTVFNIGELDEILRRGESIDIHQLPPALFDISVGQEIFIYQRHEAFDAFVDDNNAAVSLNDKRVADQGNYTVIHIGPVEEIEYRDPKTKSKLVGASNIINFVILRKHSSKYGSKIGFFDFRA